MRRLYSSFARGAPGVGLLLLRLGAGALLLADAVALFQPVMSPASVTLVVISVATGLLLMLGLWTPMAAAMAAAIGLWHALAGWPDPGLHALSVVLDVALALLGPGAWSVDARLFGWKRFVISNGDSNGHVLRLDGDDPSRI